MKVNQLAIEIGISSYSIKHFITDFDLELTDCFFPNLEVKKEFLQFATENKEFLQKYAQDLAKDKSTEDIASEIDEPVEDVEHQLQNIEPNIFDNGYYKSSISSYGIHNRLGGDYKFVYDYFGEKTPLSQRDFIGYRDLYFYITEMLNPFIDPDQAKDWGINKPAGIILYGPLGCGKIFWAKKIAEIIDYRFVEIKKYNLRKSYINGKETDFKDYLSTVMRDESKEVLFLEDFDEIAQSRSSDYQQISDNENTKQIILHNIHKFPQENLLMTASVVKMQGMDPEVFAPGRFDVKIPVFPPMPDERAQMILAYLMQNLEKDSILMQILKQNKADQKPFWQETADKMKLFSNTMMIDFTQSLKKRLRNKYLKSNDPHIVIDAKLLEMCYIECASKLTVDYMSSIQSFIKEVSYNDYDVFSKRIDILNEELSFYAEVQEPRKAIGFQQYEDEDQEEPVEE